MSNKVQNDADSIEEKEPLTEAEQIAIAMRYEGKMYSEIAKVVGFEETTIQKWFAPSYDRLYKAYCEYADKQNDLIKVLAEKKLKSLLTDAVDTIGELVKFADKDSVRLTASEGVVERALGKVTQNVNLIGAQQLNENLEALKELAGATDVINPGGTEAS
jgi:hypothetical protein